MNYENDYIPMNRGVAYDDMTPEEKQAYHARIAASRSSDQDGFFSLAEVLDKIIEQWANGGWEDDAA